MLSYHSVPSTSNIMPFRFGAPCSFVAPGFSGAKRRGAWCIDMLTAVLIQLSPMCVAMVGTRKVGRGILKCGGTRGLRPRKWGGMGFEHGAQGDHETAAPSRDVWSSLGENRVYVSGGVVGLFEGGDEDVKTLSCRPNIKAANPQS